MYLRRDFVKHSLGAMLGLFTHQLTKASAPEYVPRQVLTPDPDWSNIRQLFPLRRDQVYLNNGTMGPSPQAVIDAYVKGIQHTNEKGIYGGGEAEALSALSRYLHCDTNELALTHNVTEGINIAAWGLPLNAGEEVILTNEEHVGNGLPWLHRARAVGAKVRIASLGKTADETLENIRRMIKPETRVIAVPHIPCTNGQVLPVVEICGLAREKGILSFVDGAHGTGMLPLDLHEMGCDVYASCCHKWLLGPKGTGYLYVRKAFQDELKALFVGGYSGLDWHVHKDEPFVAESYTVGAHRYAYGTQSAAQYFGIEAAVLFHESLGVRKVSERIAELNQLLYTGLLDMGNKIELLTPEERRSRHGVVAFRVRDKSNSEIKTALDAKGYIIRFVGESELNSLRVSTHIYNSTEEISDFLTALSTHF